jgi:hypothetical protein
VLWDAGQERQVRESRVRLTQLYIGARDGYVAGNVAIGRAKAAGNITPSYARETAPPPSPERQAATIARLASLFPGAIVRRSDS